MINHFKRPYIFLPLLIVLIMLTGCSYKEPQVDDVFFVRSSSITQYVGASGRVEYPDSVIVSISQPSRIESTVVALGQKVSQGDLLAILDSVDLRVRLDKVYDDLEKFNYDLSSAMLKSSKCMIFAINEGRIKDVKFAIGDNVEDIISKYGYLALISTSGRMRVRIPDVGVLADGDMVEVFTNDWVEKGTVENKSEGQIAILMGTDTYPVGEAVKVRTINGYEVGGGMLELESYDPVIFRHGEVLKKNIRENSLVQEFDDLLTVSAYPLEVYQLKAAIQKSMSRINSYDLELKNPNVYAPVDGFITEIYDMDKTDDQESTPLFKIATMKSVRIVLDVDEYDLKYVKVGQEVQVQTDSTAESVIHGNVRAISYISVEEDAQGNAKYRVVVDTEDLIEMPTNKHVYGRILVDHYDSSIIIPISALHFTQDGSVYVLVRNASGSSKRIDEIPENGVPISTGIQDGKYIQVLFGLNEGDEVIME